MANFTDESWLDSDTDGTQRLQIQEQNSRKKTRPVYSYKEFDTHTTHSLYYPHGTHSHREETKPLLAIFVGFPHRFSLSCIAVPDRGMLKALIRQKTPSVNLLG